MDGVDFLLNRGFKEVFREIPHHLIVSSFDPTPFQGLQAKLVSEGIEIKTLQELEGDPKRDQKVYDLFWEGTGDVPQEGSVSKMTFDDWAAWTLRDPLVPHDGYFIAVHREEYIGISEFGINPADNSLQAGLVGVKKAFRHRGVAIAMQLRAVSYARRLGYELIKTSTAVDNMPMRSLYEKLGFIGQPDWIQFEKTFPDE
jgi:RimJ/RimL family protein N-acetyltransferase